MVFIVDSDSLKKSPARRTGQGLHGRPGHPAGFDETALPRTTPDFAGGGGVPKNLPLFGRDSSICRRSFMVGVGFGLDGGSGKFCATDSADQGHGNIWVHIGLGKQGDGTSVEDVVLG